MRLAMADGIQTALVQQQSLKTAVRTVAAPQARAPQQRPDPARPPLADRWYSEKRLGGLSRFAVAITILNIIGQVFLGFEQSWITPFVALAATYGTELAGETIEARCDGRPARYRGSFVDLVKFLLPAHIGGLAVGMLLYAAENIAAVAFAASVAVASKYIFRVTIGTDRGGRPIVRHVLNPSNFGITVTLLLFPTVGLAPAYQFTENTWGIVDWILPLFTICTGSYLNYRATGRIPLIMAWVIAFAVQAVLRAAVHGLPVQGELLPMTGFAFMLFTFYMITDPATSPAKKTNQIGFSAAVAMAYALFMELHVVFGLFYALTLVASGRGLWILLAGARRRAISVRLSARPTTSTPPAE